MIAIKDGIFTAWTCRMAEARAEPSARSVPNFLHHYKHTLRHITIHPSSNSWREAGADLRGRASLLSLSFSAAPCAFPRRRQAFGELWEQTSGCGGERKMEVRVGERLLWLAVLSTVLCVDSVFGKYVKGIVNTKEVRAEFVSPCAADTDWSDLNAGVTEPDCATFYAQVPSSLSVAVAGNTLGSSVEPLRAVCGCGVYFSLIVTVLGPSKRRPSGTAVFACL